MKKKLRNILNNPLKNERGLTLVEVLASIVILMIILVAFFSFFGQALLFSDKNEDKLVAYNLARKTLNVVSENYKPTTDQTISCSTYDINYHPQLKAALEPSACYYEVNSKQYYPEISMTRQNFHSFTTPVLYTVHVKIYSSDNPTDRQLLSETFGYVRGGM